METTNKTTEHGVHNSKIHDNAKIVLEMILVPNF